MLTPERLTFGSLFAGIGGLDLGLEWAGMRCLWQVEKDPFCQKVLAKRWPHVARFGDIYDVGQHNLQPVNVICGGFPCQPFSLAGEQRGAEDDRYLWPEMLRIIEELKPAYVIGENVPGIINMALDQVLYDLEAEGYTCETFVIPACAVDAPHRRDRVWIMAYADNRRQRELFQQKQQSRREASSNIGGNGKIQSIPNTQSNGGDEHRRGGDVQMGRQWSQGEAQTNGDARRIQWAVEPGVGRVANGVPNRVDRLRALGNAVVPQLGEIIGRFVVAHATEASNVDA